MMPLRFAFASVVVASFNKAYNLHAALNAILMIPSCHITGENYTNTYNNDSSNKQKQQPLNKQEIKCLVFTAQKSTKFTKQQELQ